MMKHWFPAGVALAVLAAAPRAQDTAPPTEVPKVGGAELFRQLQKELADAQRAHVKEVRAAIEKAKDGGGALPAIRMRPDLTPFVAKFEAAAQQFAGREDAVQFLVWIVSCHDASTAERDAALDTLMRGHAGSASMVEMARSLPTLAKTVGEDRADALRQALRGHNTHPAVLGWLAVDRWGSTIDEADVGSDEYVEAKQELAAFCGPEHHPALVQEIERRINMRERLGIGAIAPDIEGVDLDGEAFRLSDSRGKVIFLDFWGDW